MLEATAMLSIPLNTGYSRLRAEGDAEGAHRRLTVFRHKCPRSVFLPVLDASLTERKEP
jgi:hypothetical protein